MLHEFLYMYRIVVATENSLCYTKSHSHVMSYMIIMHLKKETHTDLNT